VKPWLCAAATALICSAAPAKDDLKLLVWINGDKGYNGLQRVGDAFEKLSGVRVEVQHPEGAPEKFQQAAGAGKGPDIFCWPHDRVGEWAKAGLIVPVRPPKAIRDEIEATSWEAFRYRGRLWGYPIGIEANGLIYNKALVPQPPATFDELISIDARLSQQGKKAVLWDFNKSFFTWPMLAGAGGFVFGKDALGDYDARQVGVNQAGAVQGAEMLQRMVQLGVMPKGARYAEMEAGFRARQGGDDDLRALGLGQRQEGRHRLRRGAHPGRGAGPAQPALRRRAGLHGERTEQAQGRGPRVSREPPAAPRAAQGGERRRAAGRAGQQGLLRRAEPRRQHPRHHGQRARRPPGAQHPRGRALLDGDGRRAGGHHQRPAEPARGAGRRRRPDAGEEMSPQAVPLRVLATPRGGCLLLGNGPSLETS
jgi:hypothetical protein